MLRTPLSNARTDRLENLTPEQILGIFASFHQAGTRRDLHKELADAWGALFSGLYLSAEDLVSGIQDGSGQLGNGNEQMLRDFISADCTSGGSFVLDVISRGGKIDRAALIMIADLQDLAKLDQKGSTALHLLADACDKRIRPVMVRKAGKKLLSEVFDSRDLPVLFSIFALTDLCRDDLRAIEEVFSRDELQHIRSRKRFGKTGLELFTAASRALLSHAPQERNKFFVNRAVMDTNAGGAIRDQGNSNCGSETRASGSGSKNADGADGPVMNISEQFDDLVTSPLDSVGSIMRRKPGTR